MINWGQYDVLAIHIVGKRSQEELPELRDSGSNKYELIWVGVGWIFEAFKLWQEEPLEKALCGSHYSRCVVRATPNWCHGKELACVERGCGCLWKHYMATSFRTHTWSVCSYQLNAKLRDGQRRKNRVSKRCIEPAAIIHFTLTGEFVSIFHTGFFTINNKQYPLLSTYKH